MTKHKKKNDHYSRPPNYRDIGLTPPQSNTSSKSTNPDLTHPPSLLSLNTSTTSHQNVIPPPKKSYSTTSSTSSPSINTQYQYEKDNLNQAPSGSSQAEWYTAESFLPEDTNVIKKRLCPYCGAKGFDIKEFDDKTRLISYVPYRIYAKKRVCTKCRNEF